MSNAPIYFFHGLESGPVGTKSTRLSEAFDDLRAPDCEGIYDIWERFEQVEPIVEQESDIVAVGSSFGGLLAALLYSAHPDCFRGYVLMAPALYDEAADEIERMPDDAVVIHGTRDDVVPIDASRETCERHGAELLEVDDDHRLHDSLDLMVERTRALVEG